VTKTCLQCGAVLPSSIRACTFCEIATRPEPVSAAVAATLNNGQRNAVQSVAPLARNAATDGRAAVSVAETDSAWRDELALRLEGYRGRKKKSSANSAQSHFSFDSAVRESASRGSTSRESTARQLFDSAPDSPAKSAAMNTSAVRLAGSYAEPEMPAPLKEDFSFTIAIGRPSKRRDEDTRMIIDVSLPPEAIAETAAAPIIAPVGMHHGLLPTATIDERRIAAIIDAGCLFFAYGAFLALFSALGGAFTVSKLSGAVCLATFAIVYLQYFALFTIFGGTTPGMMLRGLQVVSFTGEPPTPRQMLLRSAGYILSAGTLFLGFVWSMWDEDTLTWHDRISRTYLHSADSFAEVDAAVVESTQ
jgi:uncharacterized RDD family membrane protein YckC